MLRCDNGSDYVKGGLCGRWNQDGGSIDPFSVRQFGSDYVLSMTDVNATSKFPIRSCLWDIFPISLVYEILLITDRICDKIDKWPVYWIKSDVSCDNYQCDKSLESWRNGGPERWGVSVAGQDPVLSWNLSPWIVEERWPGTLAWNIEYAAGRYLGLRILCPWILAERWLGGEKLNKPPSTFPGGKKLHKALLHDFSVN